MALRLHEVHPAIVHFPLALVPTAIALDAIGYAMDKEALMNVGRGLMPIAAASALVSGVFGYVAQGAVNSDERGHELLATHRNINTALVGATGVMAAMRMRRQRPSLGYLLAGLGAVAAMSYTAYLGGKMVYAHRIGVEPEGVRIEDSPELAPGSMADAAKATVRHASEQMRQSARELSQGEVSPALRKHAEQLAHSTRRH